MSNRKARLERRVAKRKALREEEALAERERESERRAQRTQEENEKILRDMGIRDRRRAGNNRGTW